LVNKEVEFRRSICRHFLILTLEAWTVDDIRSRDQITSKTALLLLLLQNSQNFKEKWKKLSVAYDMVYDDE
jgi:hypothetical protein